MWNVYLYRYETHGAIVRMVLSSITCASVYLWYVAA